MLSFLIFSYITFISFTWNIIAEDTVVASWDRFGYILNGAFTELGYGTGVNGSTTVAVQAGDVFGYYVWGDNVDLSNITIASEFLSSSDNAAYECSDVIPAMPANLDEFLAGGGYVSDNCEIDPSSYTANESSDGQTCPETITRTFTISDYCGNTTTCVNTLTIDDTTPPVLVGVPEDMDVECDDVPSIDSFEVSAEDCSGYTIETSVVENYDPLLICQFGDAITPGNQPDWSLWLPGFGDFNAFWTADGAITLTETATGAILTGHVVNSVDPTVGFDINVTFKDRRDWTEWHSLMTTNNSGLREAKIFDPAQVGTEYENWDYYDWNQGEMSKRKPRKVQHPARSWSGVK